MIIIFFSYFLQISRNKFISSNAEYPETYFILELILTDVWICFLFNLIIQNNGIFRNVLSKFGYLGVIK